MSISARGNQLLEETAPWTAFKKVITRNAWLHLLIWCLSLFFEQKSTRQSDVLFPCVHSHTYLSNHGRAVSLE